MQKITRFVHVSTIKAGDTIVHNGKETSVCQKDLSSGFHGSCVFGDSYRGGTKLVEKIIWK